MCNCILIVITGEFVCEIITKQKWFLFIYSHILTTQHRLKVKPSIYKTIKVVICKYSVINILKSNVITFIFILSKNEQLVLIHVPHTHLKGFKLPTCKYLNIFHMK